MSSLTGRQPLPTPIAVAPPPVNWLGLLSDEERVPHDQAYAVARAGALLDRPDRAVEDLFVAANLLALVVFRSGALDAARELCRAELAYARSRPHDPQAAALALQPQINLLRIEGYRGDLDAALTGLAELEQVAAGRRARFSDLDWRPEALADDPQLLRRIRALARNIRVSDTCKLLLQRGADRERLLAEAARLADRWPTLPEHGLTHAVEVPWLLGAQPVPDADAELAALADPRLARRRLAFLRLTHQLGHVVSEDPARAGDLGSALLASISRLDGVWASSLTLPRWQAVLGSGLARGGLAADGQRLMRAALDGARQHNDGMLVRGLTERLELPEAAAPSSPPPPLEPALDRLLDALRPGPRPAAVPA